MAILSISIPSSARRSVFALSAPHTALAQPATASVATPAAISEHGHHGILEAAPPLPDAGDISRALSGLASLDELFAALKTRNAHDRQIAAEHFHNALLRDRDLAANTSNLKGLPGNAASIHMPDSLQAKLLQYASSDDVQAKWAVVTAVGETLKIHPPDAKSAARLALALFKVIPCADSAVMREAAVLFADLAPLEGMHALAHTQCAQALEWLEDSRSERKRLGAVLLLTELMKRPECRKVLNNHAPRALDDLWDHAMTDANLEIRQAGQSALEACIIALPPQMSVLHKEDLMRMALLPLSSIASSASSLHGAVLTCTVLVSSTQEGEDFVSPSWKLVMKVKERDSLVSAACMDYLSVAAKVDKAVFSSEMLHPTMRWLVEAIKREKDQIAAFDALAKILAVTPRKAVAAYQESIIVAFHVCLTQQRRSPALSDALLNTIGGLAQAFGSSIEHAITLALDAIFADGLSDHLVEALAKVLEHVPGLAYFVRIKLLDAIATILSGKTFQEFAMPVPSARRASVAVITETPKPPSMHRRRTSSLLGRTARGRSISPQRPMVPTIPEDGPDLSELALRTLATFDFSDQPLLLSFLQQHVLPFCTSEQPSLRRAAIEACHGYLTKNGLLTSQEHRTFPVRETIQTIVFAGVSDSNAEIRELAITRLDHRFDSYLRESMFAHMLIFGMNDASIRVRLAIIRVLGRIADQAKASVLPALRNELAGLLTTLDQTKNSHARMQVMTVLKEIMDAAPPLADLYSAPITNVLLDLLRNTEAEDVTVLGLEVARQLAKYAGNSLRSNAMDFVELACTALRDQASVQKRRTAVLALTEIVAQTACMGEMVEHRDDYIDALIGHLALETDPASRREVVRALGTVGALKPANSALDIADKLVQELADSPEAASSADHLEAGLIPLDEGVIRVRVPLYIADWVLGQLMEIWNEPSLKLHHARVLDAIVRIFRHEASRKRSWHYTSRIITRLIAALNEPSSDNVTTCFHISALGTLAQIVEWRVEEHTATILAILLRHWDEGLEPSNCIVDAIASLAIALRGEFQKYLSIVIPRMTAALLDAATPDGTAAAILHFMRQAGSEIREWTSSVVPAVLFACEHYSTGTRSLAMHVLLSLASATYLGSHLSRVMATLVQLTKQSGISRAAIETLCGLVKECGAEALPFALMYERQLGFSIQEHPFFQAYAEGSAAEVDTSAALVGEVNEIAEALDSDAIVSALNAPFDDAEWPHWVNKLCDKMTKATNNHHIRATAAVAEAYPPLQRKLLNYALYSAWVDLTKQQKQDICDNLHNLLSIDATAEAHDTILHLLDFMSRMGVDLKIPAYLCKEVALRRRFLHRACRYAELEYEETQEESVINDLLRIHQSFSNRENDDALGLLQHVTFTTGNEWAELGQWHSNLQAYDEMLQNEPYQPEAVKGVMRCLHALQEWDVLLDFADQKLPNVASDIEMTVAPLLARAAWSASNPTKMLQAIDHMQQPLRAWYSAVSCQIAGNHSEALFHIDEARGMLCGELVQVGRTRTGRAYDLLTRAHLLTELEEAGTYMQGTGNKELIRQRWSSRLSALQKEIDVFGRCLQVHLIAVPPSEDVKNMVKYARLCRKAERKDLAYKIQANTMQSEGCDPLDLSVIAENEFPGLTLERCRLAYEFGHKEKAREGLRDLVCRLSDRLEALTNLGKKSKKVLDKISEEKALLARTFHSLGDYSRGEDATRLSEAQICYERSTDLHPYIKGFRKLANTNLAIIDVLESSKPPGYNEAVITLAVSTVDAYSQILQRAPSFPLQDVLGLLTTIFKFGQHRDVAMAAERAFNTLSIDCYLEAVPQLTAQLNYPSARLQPIIEQHMQRLARAHPHTLLASLTAVTQYPSQPRAVVAKRLVNVMRLYDDTLVSEAMLLSEELMRTAITWEEKCCHCVEASAKYIFGEGKRNPAGLVAAMEELCKSFENPETVGEHEFTVKYGETLRVARDLGRRCLQTGSEKDLANLWRKWHTIHKICSQGIKDSPLHLELCDVSPRLAAARNMSLSVPGTYIRHGGEDIRIMEINRSLEILSSKQRPRKLTMKGSDGKTYRFLLKPREDLRLDERCMQLFTLVNSLLQSDQDASKRHLRIVRFAVVPLSHNAGLLSWFERGDTLQAIVRQHRRLFNTPVDLELKLQAQFAPGITKGTLSSLQLVEVFELALDATKGDELSSILWRKSASAAGYLERRTAYSRSMATNSMVGHILGLGDRHPSNALQDRVTGEIVHVDFGDCFQAAQERDSFPERFPFRLTRQLIRAMGPTGVEGHFRLCSQNVMRLLRENKESIEAVFSAFVHDPLIQHLVLHPRQLEYDDILHIPTENDETAQIGTPSARFSQRRRKVDHNMDKLVTQLSPRAQRVVARVREKLEGTEFGSEEAVPVDEQVSKLILQATDVFALSSAYQGWCAFW